MVGVLYFSQSTRPYYVFALTFFFLAWMPNSARRAAMFCRHYQKHRRALSFYREFLGDSLESESEPISLVGC